MYYVLFGSLTRSYWERNVCLNMKIYKCLVSNAINISNYHPLEVVRRGSDTQFQVGEN